MLFTGREVRIGKNCARGLEYSRPRAQFFLIRTDLGRQIPRLFFSFVEYFVSSFCVEFSPQLFSNLVYACIWHLGNKKSTLRSFAFLCFLGHYLHSTLFAVKKKTAAKDAKAGKLVARGPDGKIRTAGARAISQSDSGPVHTSHFCRVEVRQKCDSWFRLELILPCMSVSGKMLQSLRNCL